MILFKKMTDINNQLKVFCSKNIRSSGNICIYYIEHLHI